MNKYLLSIILVVSLTRWCFPYIIQEVEFELLDDKFRLSIPNDPDIKWANFNVNINKEFKSFETGQLNGVTSIPRDNKWSYDFDRTLKDDDIVYVWIAIQHNRLIFRDKKDPISVEAFKKGNPNYRITTTTSRTITATSTDSPVNPIDVTQENKICRQAISEVPKTFGGPYCRDDLIFSDDFNTFNEQYWTNEIRISSEMNDAKFVLYNGTLGVDKGILRIEAALNNKNLKLDSIDLGARCTSVINVESECALDPTGFLILPPVVSGRLSTKNHFHFKYGRVEVRAKMPIGDWLFPLICLQPATLSYGEEFKSGEIRVAYIRGNHNLNWENMNINGGHLFGGAIVKQDFESRHLFMKDVTLPNVSHFGNDFHLYSLTWTPNELIMAVDGKEYGRIETNFKKSIMERIWSKGGDNAPLDQMFYITLALAAGGNGDFPNVKSKPWNNTDPRGSMNFHENRGKWFPSWEQPSLEVDYVRVYAV